MILFVEQRSDVRQGLSLRWAVIYVRVDVGMCMGTCGRKARDCAFVLLERYISQP